jgi:hypothetical protein
MPSGPRRDATGREHATRQRALIAEVLSSLQPNPGSGAEPGATPEGEDEGGRLEDLIAAAVTELARRERGSPLRGGRQSLGAGVLASLMARQRGRARVDRR